MADKVRYPQIPSTVWWGVRSILQRSPSATIDERLLGVQLGVQETAARAYVSELRAVGILTDEGKATPLAQKWRLDDSYGEAARELSSNVYPEGLLHVAPPGEADRQKIVSWFQREGLGQGAAGNKAATYLLLSSLEPNEAPARSASRSNKDEVTARGTSASAAAPVKAKPSAPAKVGSGRQNTRPGKGRPDGIPLNINVQIHISADAGTDQIEAIFSAMRRHLYDAPVS